MYRDMGGQMKRLATLLVLLKVGEYALVTPGSVIKVEENKASDAGLQNCYTLITLREDKIVCSEWSVWKVNKVLSKVRYTVKENNK